MADPREIWEVDPASYMEEPATTPKKSRIQRLREMIPTPLEALEMTGLINKGSGEVVGELTEAAARTAPYWTPGAGYILGPQQFSHGWDQITEPRERSSLGPVPLPDAQDAVGALNMLGGTLDVGFEALDTYLPGEWPALAILWGLPAHRVKNVDDAIDAARMAGRVADMRHADNMADAVTDVARVADDIPAHLDDTDKALFRAKRMMQDAGLTPEDFIGDRRTQRATEIAKNIAEETGLYPDVTGHWMQGVSDADMRLLTPKERSARRSEAIARWKKLKDESTSFVDIYNDRPYREMDFGDQYEMPFRFPGAKETDQFGRPASELVDFRAALKRQAKEAESVADAYGRSTSAYGSGEGVPLWSVLEHDEAYKAIPELRNIDFAYDPGLPDSTMGSFDDSLNRLRLNPAYSGDELKMVLGHELNHAAAKFTGAPQGTFVGGFVNKAEMDKVRSARSMLIQQMKADGFDDKKIEAAKILLDDLSATRNSRDVLDVVARVTSGNPDWVNNNAELIAQASPYTKRAVENVLTGQAVAPDWANERRRLLFDDYTNRVGEANSDAVGAVIKSDLSGRPRNPDGGDLQYIWDNSRKSTSKFVDRGTPSRKQYITRVMDAREAQHGAERDLIVGTPEERFLASKGDTAGYASLSEDFVPERAPREPVLPDEELYAEPHSRPEWNGLPPDRSGGAQPIYQPKKSTARMQALKDRLKSSVAAIKGLDDDLYRGVTDFKGADWYNTEQAYQIALKVANGDPVLAQRMLDEKMLFEAASSSGANVEAQGFTAAAMQRLYRDEADVPGSLRNFKEHLLATNSQADNKTLGQMLPKGAGHKNSYHHIGTANAMLRERDLGIPIPPDSYQKPRSFKGALMGNPEDVAVDLHAFRRLGQASGDPAFLNTGATVSKAFRDEIVAQYPDAARFFTDNPKSSDVVFKARDAYDSGVVPFEAMSGYRRVFSEMPTEAEYADAKGIFADLKNRFNRSKAKRSGKPPLRANSQAQAGVWVGAGDETGVSARSDGTFMENRFRLAKARAEKTGRPVSEVLDDWMAGKQTLGNVAENPTLKGDWSELNRKNAGFPGESVFLTHEDVVSGDRLHGTRMGDWSGEGYDDVWTHEIAKALGPRRAMEAGVSEGQGIFNGQISGPNRVPDLRVRKEFGPLGNEIGFPADVKDALDATNMGRALGDIQQAEAYTVPFRSDNMVPGQNSVLGRWFPGSEGPLSPDEVARLSEVGRKYGRPDINDLGSGFVATNYGGDMPKLPVAKESAMRTEMRRALAANRKANLYETELLPDTYISAFERDDYVPGKGVLTRDFLDRMNRLNPQIRDALNSSVEIPKQFAKKAAIAEAAAAQTGVDAEDILNLMKTIGEGPDWIERLEDAVKRGVALPAVAAAILGAAAMQSQGMRGDDETAIQG